MTINDPEKYCAGLWDWAILDGCFGSTKIRPTDIDGEVERHGRFLIFETKQPGANIPYGQMLTFEAKRQTGIFTIFIVWGRTNRPEQLQMLTSKIISKRFLIDLARFQAASKRWYEWADSLSTPVWIDGVRVETK